MSSKVIVNLPTDPFQQITTKHQQPIVSLDRSAILGLTSSDPAVRAHQLEQNIRFLQEQHQIMLNGLHNEIEILRQKNRDLQFQIVFSKEVNIVQMSPTSSDDSHSELQVCTGKLNVTPIQIESLERNIAELHNLLSESKTKNVYLQSVIDEQKKKLSALENEKLDLAAIGKKLGKENLTKNKSPNTENMLDQLQEKLEDAERLIRRLRRENEEQRKEIVSLRTSINKGKLENRRNDGGNMSYRIFYRNGQAQSSRFPPLHNYSHCRNSVDNSSIHISDSGSNRKSKEPEIVGRSVPSLPYLRDRNNATTSTGYSNPAYNNYQSMNTKKGYYHYYRKQDDYRPSVRTSRREQCNQQNNER